MTDFAGSLTLCRLAREGGGRLSRRHAATHVDAFDGPRTVPRTRRR
jgi:hypothetical protein